MLRNVEGVVLKSIPYGETNLICTLFTKENGKIAVMVRGARKTKSSLRAVAHLFTHGLFLIQGERGMGTLRQGETVTSFRTLREDLEKTACAACMVDLTDRLTEDRQPDPFLFELLLRSLGAIDEGKDPLVLLSIYEIKLMRLAGISPMFDQCVGCAREGDAVAFSMHEGGIVCRSCAMQSTYAEAFHPSALKLLRLFSSFDLNRLGNINVSFEVKKDLQRFITQYYDEQAGIRLKSKRFLDQLHLLNLDSH
ncbi:DNA repair protein RecO [Aureibacillus halotolerans]|uniref:DNA repair protein RecO n=1 Tax=Aureibacillus halotolerans TaxID=1508390 RepID=A0A4R6U5H4_9BACI|nr:DNA repair protein RecO [Aureibacillus halotolerans]TDQ41730.1 DNA replication and repair protein RecO [Aureibacillus halotolerans]